MLTIHYSVLYIYTQLDCREERKREHTKSPHFTVHVVLQDLKIFPINSSEIIFLGEDSRVQCLL